jgi:hypothetical protein
MTNFYFTVVPVPASVWSCTVMSARLKLTTPA